VIGACFQDQQNKKPQSVPLPTLGSLLDCSFAKSIDVLRALAWGFLCTHSKLVGQDYDPGQFVQVSHPVVFRLP
jgi:hypothetical protein